MEIFYSNNIANEVIILDIFETKHCIKVLRKKVGDSVNVVDGKGNLFVGNIESYNNKHCYIKINKINKDYGEKDYYIHIAISPIKNHDRMEWFIEKSVEIGIDEISFINCNRTIRKKINIDRLNKIAIIAMKQTLKAKIPKINAIMNIDNFIDTQSASNKFICHLEEDIYKTIFDYKNEFKFNASSCIMIGPEGDFTIEEINRSKKNNFLFLSLGTSRLRTETAGVVACHLLNIIHNNYE